MVGKLNALPTIEELREHRRERLENGFTFPLVATSIGREEPIVVRVRRLSTIDKAVIRALPSEMQDVIWAGLEEFQKEQRKMQDAEEASNLEEMMVNNDKIVAAADAWCQAAFIYPLLVPSEKERAGREGVWTLNDVDPEDRVALLMACLDADSPANKKLKLFRPQWGHAVADGEALPVAEAAERTVESGGGGLHALPTT